MEFNALLQGASPLVKEYNVTPVVTTLGGSRVGHKCILTCTLANGEVKYFEATSHKKQSALIACKQQAYKEISTLQSPIKKEKKFSLHAIDARMRADRITNMNINFRGIDGSFTIDTAFVDGEGSVHNYRFERHSLESALGALLARARTEIQLVNSTEVAGCEYI